LKELSYLILEELGYKRAGAGCPDSDSNGLALEYVLHKARLSIVDED
jgi:hypothetical protein